MPAIPIIAAGISAGGALGGAYMVSSAAKKGGQTQLGAAQQVGEETLRVSDEESERLRATGERGAVDITEAATKAGAGMWLSADEANALLRSLYGNAMDMLEPYMATGKNAIQTLNAALGPGGDFNRPFTGADLENEPGYQFRLAEGAKLLERGAAARGTLLGGRGLKEMERYAQGYASDEFGKAFQRYSQDRAERFGMLYNLAGVGLRATETGIGAGETYGGRAAGNIMRAGEYEGNINYEAANRANLMRVGTTGDAAALRLRGREIWGNTLTGAANTSAASSMASGNAWSNAFNNLSRIGMNYAYLNAPTPRTPYEPSPVPTVGHYDPATGRWISG